MPIQRPEHGAFDALPQISRQERMCEDDGNAGRNAQNRQRRETNSPPSIHKKKHDRRYTDRRQSQWQPK